MDDGEPRSYQKFPNPMLSFEWKKRNLVDLVSAKDLLNGLDPARRKNEPSVHLLYKLPSGNLLHSYGKSPFIVDLAIENGDFP